MNSDPSRDLAADCSEMSALLERCVAHFPGFIEQLRAPDWPLEMKQREARDWYGNLGKVRDLIRTNPFPNPHRRRQLAELRKAARQILRWL